MHLAVKRTERNVFVDVGLRIVSMFGSGACDRRMRRVETRDPNTTEYTGSVDELNALRVNDAILEAA